MNINALRKNYTRLTPKERFAALCAANARGDKQEIDALIETAPKLTFSVRHHFGMVKAFDLLAMFHQTRQLANAGILLMVLAIGDEAPDHDDLYQAACEIAERYKTGAAAWAALCGEYGLTPEPLITGLPGDDVLNFVTRFADIFHDDPDLPRLQEYLADLRQAIESMAKDWGA